MALKLSLAEAVQSARRLKEDIVAHQGIGEDIAPVLHLTDRDAGRYIGGFSLSTDRERRLRQLGDIVGLSDAPLVHYVHEAYQELFDRQPSREAALAAWTVWQRTYNYGSLAQRFAAGDQRIVECVVVLVATATEQACAWCPYRYEGRRVVWFDQTTTGDGDPNRTVDSEFVNAMRDGFARRTGSGLAPERISTLLEIPVVLPDAPARNSLCPCGSGRKVKFCCWR
jgi:hypothetical protein